MIDKEKEVKKVIDNKKLINIIKWAKINQIKKTLS